jgi:uncharacterized membrane protein
MLIKNFGYPEMAAILVLILLLFGSGLWLRIKRLVKNEPAPKKQKYGWLTRIARGFRMMWKEYH